MIAVTAAFHYLCVNRRYVAYFRVLLLGAVFALPSSALAQAAARLHYTAPAGCPAQAEFEAAVAARGGQFDSEPARDSAFDVSINAAVEGFRASLTVRSATGTSNPREVRAASCDAVADALAVVTAIALNPDAPADIWSEPRSDARPSAPPKITRPALRGGADLAPRVVHVDAGELRLDHALALEAFAGPVIGFVSGRASERLDITASRANFVSLPSGQSYLLGTIVRLRGSVLFNRTYRLGDFSSEVGGQEVGASLCFSPHYDTDGWVLLGCAEISAGLLALRTKDATGKVTQDKTQGFGALGLSIETSYNLAAHFQLGLRLGAQTLTSRTTAERPDGSELLRSSGVMASGMLGVGTHF